MKCIVKIHRYTAGGWYFEERDVDLAMLYPHLRKFDERITGSTGIVTVSPGPEQVAVVRCLLCT